MHRPGNHRSSAEQRLWSPAVLARYWILQLPEAALIIVIMLLLQRWLGFPAWVPWTVLALWVAKDAALYPWVWRSFDPGYPSTMHSLDGHHAVATEPFHRSGYVRLRGELWHAELEHGGRPVDKGEVVEVRSRRGLTVIVAAIDVVQAGAPTTDERPGDERQEDPGRG